MIRFGTLWLACAVLAACSPMNTAPGMDAGHIQAPARDMEAWQAAATKQLAPRLLSYFGSRNALVVQPEAWTADVSLTVDDAGAVVSVDATAPSNLSWIREGLLTSLQEGGRIIPPPPLAQRSWRPAMIFMRLHWAPKPAGI